MLGSTKLWQFTQTVPARIFGTRRCTALRSFDPDAGAQAIGRVVRQGGDFVEILEALRHQHGPEDLLAHDRHVRTHVGQHGGLHEEARRDGASPPVSDLARPPCGPIRCSPAPAPAAPSTPADPSRSSDRGPARVGSRAAAALTPSTTWSKILLCAYSRDPAAAHLAGIEENGVGGAADHRVDIRVRQHDHRRLSAQLERHPLQGIRRGLVDDLAHLGRAGEGDLVDARMRDQRGAGGLAHCR